MAPKLAWSRQPGLAPQCLVPRMGWLPQRTRVWVSCEDGDVALGCIHSFPRSLQEGQTKRRQSTALRGTSPQHLTHRPQTPCHAASENH